MKLNIIKSLIVVSTLSLGAISCNRFLDITPTGKVIPQTEEDFRALLTRAYNLYPQHKALMNLRTDEVNTTVTNESYGSIFTWADMTPLPGTQEYPYISFYQTIFYTNYIIENAPKNISSGAIANQILGEAYALRAYTYFELINLYAPVYNGSNGSAAAVPLITKVQLEGDFPRASLEAVYNQIISDLDTAGSLINQNQFDVGYNYRFTSVAVNALKSRVYLYKQDWAKALEEAEKVLSVKSSLEDLSNSTILPSNYKSIESIMNLDVTVNSGTESFAKVSDEHISLFDKDNDLRFSKYFVADLSNYKTTKYNRDNELKISFRVGEILLIKAEAQAKLGNEQGSKATLLTLAEKRYNALGLTNFTTKINGLSGNAYYAELLNERARETSFEGLRWFDLRRTTQPSIVHVYNGISYTLNTRDARYTIPFPTEARLKNPSLN